jgi:hypothetical protein
MLFARCPNPYVCQLNPIITIFIANQEIDPEHSAASSLEARLKSLFPFMVSTWNAAYRTTEDPQIHFQNHNKFSKRA